MRILSGANRCDRETIVENGPVVDHRFMEVIIQLKEKMTKKKTKITRESRKKPKTKNIELKLSQLGTRKWR